MTSAPLRAAAACAAVVGAGHEQPGSSRSHRAEPELFLHLREARVARRVVDVDALALRVGVRDAPSAGEPGVLLAQPRAALGERGLVLGLGLLALDLAALELGVLRGDVARARRDGPARDRRDRLDVDLAALAARPRLVGVVRDAALVDALVHLRLRRRSKQAAAKREQSSSATYRVSAGRRRAPTGSVPSRSAPPGWRARAAGSRPRPSRCPSRARWCAWMSPISSRVSAVMAT